MSSVCISSCVNDTQLAPSRVRATYVSLHQWPESDVEFVRSLSFRSTGSGGRGSVGPAGGGPKVVDTISCRQVYLRSYTFTRKEETMNERTTTIKCFGKVKDKVVNGRNNKNKKKRNEKYYYVTLKSLFRKLIFCSYSVDVMDVDD